MYSICHVLGRIVMFYSIEKNLKLIGGKGSEGIRRERMNSEGQVWGQEWAWKAETAWTSESGRWEKDEEETHHDQKPNHCFGGVLIPCLFWETPASPAGGIQEKPDVSGEGCLPLSQFDFPRNLEFGIGNASLNLGWSLELGTQKWNSCEAFVCLKKQWKLMPWKGSVNQGGRITSLQSEWSLSKWCLKVFFLILRTPKPGSASAFEFKRYPLSYCHVPICAWVHASGHLRLVAASIWLSLALTVHLPVPVFLLSPGSVIFKVEEPSHACPYWCLCGVELKIVRETWGQVKMKSRKKYPVFFHFFGQYIQLILSVSSIQMPCNVQR